MTVPTHFRRNSEVPGILVLHYADLSNEDVRTAQGFKFTRPPRTILDLIEADSIERSFLRQAMTVSGLTMTKADRQSFHTSHSYAQRSRSADVSFGRFTERMQDAELVPDRQVSHP